MSPVSSDRMSPLEIRASLSLASIFALRMLGLFLILPVFAVHATHLEGGDNHTLVGIALGAYGLTQGMLQIPYGMASDRYGRKRIIILGLVLFALGSFIAADRRRHLRHHRRPRDPGRGRDLRAGDGVSRPT